MNPREQHVPERRPLVAAGLTRRAYLRTLGGSVLTGGLISYAGPARAATTSAVETRQALSAAYPYLSRADWGADESWRFDRNGTEIWPPQYRPVQTVSVHHTADGSSDPDPAARVRSIYRKQAVDAGFGDIGYHFLIDAAGRVYEGRWSGNDGVPAVNPAGRMVTGAHILGYNAGNAGIALLGNFTGHAPTRAARQVLVLLLAEWSRSHRLSPLGTVHYVNPDNGATRTVPTISGHNDWAPTECPGRVLAADLPAIRLDVAAALSHASRA
jgi:hypothetical protein